MWKNLGAIAMAGIAVASGGSLADEMNGLSKALDVSFNTKSQQNADAVSGKNNISDGIGCFVAGTQVKTAEGDRNIEDVEVGDYVLAENPETGEQGYKKVVRTYIHEKELLVHVYVGDEEIETTAEHPFYVEGTGFVSAGELRAGDIIRTADGRNLPIVKVETEEPDKPIYVYNFEVEDYHTYYVSETGVLVHNMCARTNSVESGSNTVNPNALKYNGDGTWTSNEGLIYGQGSREGNRVRHVLEHTKPNPNKPVHTVFNVDKSNVIGLVDEAWAQKGVGSLAGNGYVTYNIDMGKVIGTNGESSIRIVTNGYTDKLISAYPIP